MVKINTLRISDDGQLLLIDVATSIGNTFSQILLWTDVSYKDPNLSLDLSSFITGSNNREVLSIPVEEISPDGFDGIYFVEFYSTDMEGEDDCTDCGDGILMGVTANLTKYHECILNGAMAIVLGKDNTEVLEAQLLLDGIYTSLRFGWYQEAITMLRSLEEYCNACHTCGDLVTPTFKKNIGFGILNKTMKLS